MPPTTIGSNSNLHATRKERTDLPQESLIHILYDQWLALSNGEMLPSRAQFDPISMDRNLLPWIFMLDVLTDDTEMDYRYRLAGTGNVQLVGRDATGKLASSIFGDEDRRYMMETFHMTVREKCPTYWHAGVPHERNRHVNIFRGIFPLSTDGTNVDILISAAVPERPLVAA